MLALVRAADVRGDGYLSAVTRAVPPFAPTATLSEQLLMFLHREGFIWLDPASPPEAFLFEQHAIVDVRPRSAKWIIALPGLSALLDELERRAIGNTLPSSWLDEARHLHLCLAAAECRSYFDRCLHERGLPPASSSKADKMITNLLLEYSVSQALRIIWGGAQWTADFLARKQVHRAHAANYAIGACQRFADKARAESWNIKGFRRPYDLPRSILGCVLHDVVLRVGDRGFDEPAQAIWPSETWTDQGLSARLGTPGAPTAGLPQPR